MSDIVQELRAMQGMGDVQLKALMDGVGPKGAEEIKRLRAELAETRANYEQYGTAMGQNLEDRDSEIERLRAELDDAKINIQFLVRIKASYEELIGEMQSTWLSKDTYETLMRERAETLKEMADMRAELDALKAWKEEVEKQEPVAWLHESRRDSDVVTSAVKHVWQRARPMSLAAYSIPLYLAPGAKGEEK